jgi:hypothetical protein
MQECLLCEIVVWVDVVRLVKMVLNGALRESPRNMIQGWYKILKNIQTKQAGNIRSHESHESREV